MNSPKGARQRRDMGFPRDELEHVRRPLELALEKILGDPRQRGLPRIERVGREVGVAERVVPTTCPSAAMRRVRSG